MRLLFSTSDPRKFEPVLHDLSTAGIACETRHVSGSDDGSGIPVYPELWIKRDEDYGRASRLLARRGTC